MNEQILTSLRQHETHAGTWLGLGSTVTTELAAKAGFDWVLIDLEHGLGTENILLQQLQALSAYPAAAIVRVGHLDASLIARALDWGAHGIMLPQVDTVQKAKACLDLMQYPPLGSRGYSSSARAYGYGLEKSSFSSQTQPLFLAQVESLAGVQEVEAIAALPGVDVLFIGPTDLKLDLESSPLSASITLADCIEKVIAAAAKKMESRQVLF